MTVTGAQSRQSEPNKGNDIQISQSSFPDLTVPKTLSTSTQEFPESRSMALENSDFRSGKLSPVKNEDELLSSSLTPPQSVAPQQISKKSNSTENSDEHDKKNVKKTRKCQCPTSLLLQWTFTFLWCSGTTIYASLAHREQPLAIPILTNPQLKIAFLALLCASSGLLIFQLVLKTLEKMRWRLVCCEQGMGMYDFIGMSPSTNAFQICKLIYFDPKMKGSLGVRLKTMFFWHGWNLRRYDIKGSGLKYRLLFQILTGTLSLVLIGIP
jgi:hypothetical protein